jgi:hypothetical protein
MSKMWNDRAYSRRRALPGRLGIVVALASAVLGCASGAPRTHEPAGTEAEGSGRWVCEAWEGTTSEPWYGGFETWQEGNGVMSSVHGTPWGHGGEYGRATEEEAVTDALRSGASGALDLLERRGLTYGDERRAEIEERTVETLLQGGEPSFPRVHLGGKVVERCRERETGKSAWRAKVLIQYPIGELRGDVVNAKWERERILREVEVLKASASAHFTEGRWLDGKLDLERALTLLGEAGTALPDIPERTVDAPPWGRPDATQAERAWRQETEIKRTATPLSMKALGTMEVVEIGARGHAEAAFLVTYAWEGEEVPAIGVPVRYELEGDAAAILDGDAVTDGEGIARCRILRAYGEPGEYRLSASVDTEFIRRAGVSNVGSLGVLESGPSGRLGAPSDSGLKAWQRVFLVSGGHGTIICAHFTGERERDAAEARMGFVQRMSNEGYLTEDCGPEVDVVVTATVRLVTVVVPGSWTAEVTVEGSAFDQRLAREIDETVLTVADTSEEGQRNAELRALREAGRLMAVYFSERILTSGD